jgi:hypothetical protein
MSKSDGEEKEKEIGSVVWYSVARLPKKNHDARVQIAKQFNAWTQVGAEGQELIVFKRGNSTINVYESQYAGTNQATAVTWVAREGMECIVQQLSV